MEKGVERLKTQNKYMILQWVSYGGWLEDRWYLG